MTLVTLWSRHMTVWSVDLTSDIALETAKIGAVIDRASFVLSHNVVTSPVWSGDAEICATLQRGWHHVWTAWQTSQDLRSDRLTDNDCNMFQTGWGKRSVELLCFDFISQGQFFEDEVQTVHWLRGKGQKGKQKTRGHWPKSGKGQKKAGNRRDSHFKATTGGLWSSSPPSLQTLCQWSSPIANLRECVMVVSFQ